MKRYNERTHYHSIFTYLIGCGVLIIWTITASRASAEKLEEVAHCDGCGDFNGDGYMDLVLGVIQEDVGEIRSAGAVNVIYGSALGIHADLEEKNQIWSQDSPGILGHAESFDYFGSSLTSGDFNDDGYDDLAIGVPYEDVGSIPDSGSVNVIYGSAQGLHADLEERNQIWSQNAPGILGHAEFADEFGSSLTSGDFNDDGYDDLAIGVPYEDVGSIPDSGSVNVIYGSAQGLHADLEERNQIWSQNAPGILGHAERKDLFGWSLTSGDFNDDGYDDLAIGVIIENLGRIPDAGAVNVIYGSAQGLHADLEERNQIWRQNSPRIQGHAERSDRFGTSLTSGDFNDDGYGDLAIGVLSDNVGDIEAAGSVNVIYGSAQGLHADLEEKNQIWSQDSPGIFGHAGRKDLFGWSLTSGDFNDDGYADLAMGVVSDAVGVLGHEGSVNIIYGSAHGLHADLKEKNQIWSQDSPGILGTSEPADNFGSSLTSGDFNDDGYVDLAIVVRREDVGGIINAGSANVIYGSAQGLHADLEEKNQIWSQDSPGILGTAEPFDELGSTLR